MNNKEAEMLGEAAQLMAACFTDRRTKEVDGVQCNAKPGECRYLYPYNSHKVWVEPIPTKECLETNCPSCLNRRNK